MAEIGIFYADEALSVGTAHPTRGFHMGEVFCYAVKGVERNGRHRIA